MRPLALPEEATVFLHQHSTWRRDVPCPWDMGSQCPQQPRSCAQMPPPRVQLNPFLMGWLPVKPTTRGLSLTLCPTPSGWTRSIQCSGLAQGGAPGSSTWPRGASPPAWGPGEAAAK